MKIGILYICTGKYDKFFDDFYNSSEKYFLSEHIKKYYVFTDSNKLIKKYENNNNIEFIEQKKLGWPLDTLMRFWMFKSINDKLSQNDFLVFFNANCLFVENINEREFLPNYEKGERYIGALHGWLYNKPFILYPYERNKKSTAYISYYKKGKYFQGSLNGGYTNDYLNLINKCFENTNIDLSKNYIAKVHDESHLNKFFIGRKDIKVLDISYNYPENSNLKFNAKIILRDKKGGDSHKELRN